MGRRLAAVTVVACALCPAGANAQAIQNVVLRNSFSLTGAGARGLGMGGAFVAVADDGTAASFNPAGLAQLRRSEIAAVGFYDKLVSSVTFPTPSGTDTISTTTEHGAPDFFGLAVPFEVGGRTLTVQLSYQRSVDLFGEGRATVQNTIPLSDIDPDLSGTGDFIADVVPEQRGAFHTISLSGGYQTTERMYLGAAVNYWIADWTARGRSAFRLRLRQPGGGPPLDVPVSQTDFVQDQSMTALSFNLGLLLKYPRVSVGLVTRFGFTGNYDLDENDVVTNYLAGRALPPQSVSYRVKTRASWPFSVGLGIALRPFKGLTLAGDYSKAQWSRTTLQDMPDGSLLTPVEEDADGNPVEQYQDLNFFDLLPASVTTTSNTDSWHAGGEYLVVLPKIIVPLRGGWFRDRSPITDLESTEGKEIDGWTLGTGLNFSRLALDFAFERRTSTGRLALRLRGGQPVDPGPLGVSTETVRQDRFVASLIYRAGGDDDPLKRMFRYLFGNPKEGDEP